MKDHEINQAIAESVGGGYLTDCVGGFWFVIMNGCKYGPFTEDLNAMHEVEKMLTDHWDGFHFRNHIANNVHATARQRAEAYLRTIEKWRVE